MKVETLIKIGTVGAAVTATAVGSFVLTAKAVKKLENEAFPENPMNKGINLENNPAVDKLMSGALKASEAVKAKESFSTDFKHIPQKDLYVPSDVEQPKDTAEPVNDFEVVKPTVEINEIKEEAEPIPTPIPEPIPAPIPEPVPAPVEEEGKYTNIPMDLPYLAGKLEENEEASAPEETPAEPAAAPVEPAVEAPAEPQVVLSNAESIDENPSYAPISSAEEEKPQTFADINPIAQGFAVGMTDIDGNNLPTADETSAPETFADILPTAGETVAEPANAAETSSDTTTLPTPEETTSVETADINIPPVVEETLPAEEKPAPKEPETSDGSTVKIGAATVSDNKNNTEIEKVVAAFGVKADNLVSIVADQAMVFEFLYPDMRNDATLVNVYFVLPDGQVTLPPEKDKENVLAFGRNFITENEEFKKFLLA